MAKFQSIPFLELYSITISKKYPWSFCSHLLHSAVKVEMCNNMLISFLCSPVPNFTFSSYFIPLGIPSQNVLQYGRGRRLGSAKGRQITSVLLQAKPQVEQRWGCKCSCTEKIGLVFFCGESTCCTRVTWVMVKDTWEQFVSRTDSLGI